MSNAENESSRVNQPLKQAIEALLTDRPVAYHPIITRVVGSATAGIFLSQLLYWTPRAHDPGAWVYKTQGEILEETGLTRTEQETARRILRGAGVMEETKRGLPAKLYFRVSMDRLIALLSAFAPTPGKRRRPADAAATFNDALAQARGDAAGKDAGILQPRMRESRSQARGDAADKFAEMPQTLTEITTETTTESVVVVQDTLEKFGLTAAIAERLAKSYPTEYVMGKLDLVQWLVETGSPLVERNPPGYLRRAVEEDYRPPPAYKSADERHAEERAHAATAAATHAEVAALEAAHAEATEVAQERLIAATPPLPVVGTGRTTAAVWDEVLAQLREQVTGPIFATWLRHTRLVACDSQQAVVATVQRYTAEQLAGRLHPRVLHALASVLGHPVTCTYITLHELTDGGAARAAGQGEAGAGRRGAGGPYAAG